jgi:hypothetical protein
MKQTNHHVRQVDIWVEEKLKGQNRKEMIDSFNEAFQRVWTKAELTLGSVTMLAVADRIKHISREAYPWLAPIQKKNDGIDVTGLAQGESPMSEDELRQGLSFMLGEFLRLLGNLTAEIISPKLHASLREDRRDNSSDSEDSSKNKDSHSPVSKGGKT